MAFPRKLLNEDEDIVLDLHPHWWYLSGPIVALVVAAIAGIVLQGVGEGVPNTALRTALIPLVVIALIWLIIRYLKWTTTEFVVTTERLIQRNGVLGKHGREIPLDRINDISFHQAPFERMIRAGDLVIESGGERGQQHIPDIANPSDVQNAIYRQVEAFNEQRHGATVVQQAAQDSIPEQIEKLDELRQRGVISQAEF